MYIGIMAYIYIYINMTIYWCFDRLLQTVQEHAGADD